MDIIKDTNYGVFMIDPAQLQLFISKHADAEGIIANPFGAYEMKMYRYGAIRHVKNPFVTPTSKKKQQYDVVQTYVTQYVQHLMQAAYGLEKVMVPEDRHLKDG